jgi:hypothetical protein
MFPGLVLDSASIPRQSIFMIGLGDPPLPPPRVRNPLQDELHLRDGSIHPGPLVSLDARRAIPVEGDPADDDPPDDAKP